MGFNLMGIRFRQIYLLISYFGQQPVLMLPKLLNMPVELVKLFEPLWAFGLVGIGIQLFR